MISLCFKLIDWEDHPYPFVIPLSLLGLLGLWNLSSVGCQPLDSVVEDHKANRGLVDSCVWILQFLGAQRPKKLSQRSRKSGDDWTIDASTLWVHVVPGHRSSYSLEHEQCTADRIFASHANDLGFLPGLTYSSLSMPEIIFQHKVRSKP